MLRLPRFLFEPRTIRFAASVSPGWGHLLLRRFEWALPLMVAASVVDWFALRAFLDDAHVRLAVLVAFHFALILGGWLHVNQLLSRRKRIPIAA